ncbi:MAG: 16S rRNA (cytosine(1402)-N(4))-methyltransferase RsmH, partial [Actinobacteria bacterium]|nr:16S rRNA (cytosine(1402)-N(4))-methyltransferase RsmH [Actinomycetota bacterium]
MDSVHRPVLVDDVVRLLGGSGLVIDATVGLGGHALALLDGGVRAIVGVDRDASALRRAEERLAAFGPRFRTVRSRFSAIADAVRRAGVAEADGVLMDLGVSSMQLDEPARGFGFRVAGPLDMRMGGEEGPVAADVVNNYPEEELARVIFEYGEERFSRRIAGAIVRARTRAPLQSTDELARIVAGAVPSKRGGPHPARRTFQAIRIEVNQELEELAAVLPQAAGLLRGGGRLVVIAYHSLEDRIVKRFVRDESTLRPLTKKPLRPGAEETVANPRARSARLRA